MGRYEQATVVQPQYDFLLQAGEAGLASPFTNEIHPYHRAFLIDLPTGDIRQFDPRWQWINLANGMFENWGAADVDERARLVQLPFDQILRGDFGIPGRPDLLPPRRSLTLRGAAFGAGGKPVNETGSDV